MANSTGSGLLFDSVNKMLTTYVPVHHQSATSQLYDALHAKSFGTIKFPDNKSNRAEFIRIPPDASVNHVRELLNAQWCGERPSLVISITGGAKEYNMKPKLLRAFRRGLLKVARTTGAWIITGGMNTGIMKLVGEIVQINPDRSRPIHLIGIATWGCVSNFKDLDVRGSHVDYAKSRSEQKGEAPLEPNHTEFILIDDGSVRKYGGEIQFRAKLEQAISGGFFASKPATTNLTSQNNSLSATTSIRPEQSDPVPVVLIVVEGGPNTVRTVHEAVVQNNIPAVLLEGTGRCCDLFAKAYRLYNEQRQRTELRGDGTPMNDDELKNKLRTALAEELAAFNGSGDGGAAAAAAATGKPPRTNAAATTTSKKPAKVDNTDYFELVYECIDKRRRFLNIISLNSRNPVEPDIDLVILQALLNATSGNDSGKTDMTRKQEQLRLALEWNRIDIAKNCIMRNERDWEKVDLSNLFEMAMANDQVAFVKLFLEHDFSLSDFFRDHRKFVQLYTADQTEFDSLMNAAESPLRRLYKKVIQPMIGDFFDVDAAFPLSDFTSNHEAVDIEGTSTCCSCYPRRYQAPIDRDGNGSINSQTLPTYSGARVDIDKELFLWSLINGRREFALLFWSRGKNKICSALLAALIYRKRARRENDASFNQSADEFENLAVQILDKFYQSSYHACTKAIIRKIPAYGNVTWLEVAVAAEAKQFIAQRAVQDVLNNIWYGCIDQREGDMTIVFTTINLWYSGFLRYEKELVTTSAETSFFDSTTQKPHPTNSRSQRQGRLVNSTRTFVSRYIRNVKTFMSAPYVKYLYNLYFHVFFLLLFSYVILCDFFPLYDFPAGKCGSSGTPPDRNNGSGPTRKDRPNADAPQTGDRDPSEKQVFYGAQPRALPANTEILLVIWVFTLLCEEIRQLFSTEAQSKRNAISAYFSDFWNKLDVLAIVLFVVSMILRFLPWVDCFCAARIILSVDLTLWFMRSLNLFAAVKRLGPKLVMIGEMVHDLKFFMLMLIVFILAFGVSSYSLIYGVQKFSWHLPREIVNLAYWQIFGELNALETFEHNYTANGYAAFILLVGYMAVVSILLVNLLIAMFSNTFDRLQTDTDRIWKFQRYSLVCEYLSRPSLPPPLIVFSHIWRFLLYTSARCLPSRCIQAKYQQHSSHTKYKTSLSEKATSIIEVAEDALGDEVYYNYSTVDRKLVDETDLDEERINSPQESMLNKIRALENRVQTMTNQQAQMFDYLECLMEGMTAIAGEKVRIRTPEGRRLDHEESLINSQVDDDLMFNNYLQHGYHTM